MTTELADDVTGGKLAHEPFAEARGWTARPDAVPMRLGLVHVDSTRRREIEAQSNVRISDGGHET